MEKVKEKTAVDRIWDFLASVKLAVVIFLSIALTSMVGTFLEQEADPAKNMIALTKIFGESLAPAIYDILFRLGFMNMYRSVWFQSLLLLFTVNIIICSIDRLPRILKLVREKISPLPMERLEKMPIRRGFTLKGRISDIREPVSAGLRAIGFRHAGISEDSGLQLYAEKGNFTRLGVYITHLSILIILVGAIIGSLWGFNAYLQLNEGETASVVFKFNDRKAIPLGFDIRCDNFAVEYYGNSDTPKDYKSWLTVIKDNKEVKKKTIEVNDPLTYEGITFYQSSYGTDSNRINNGIFVLRLVSTGGQTAEINPRIGDTFTIPGTKIQGHITDFSPALSLDSRSGRAFTYSEQMLNPAVYIEFSDSGEQKYSGWLLKRYPQTWKMPDGNQVEFLEYWGVEYTGMQVRKDPGVLIVYLGCIIMSLGLFITFFMSHKRIWIHLAEGKNSTKIVIGASSNKNRAALEKKVEKLAGIINSGQKGGKG